MRPAHKDHSRGGKVSDADASVRGRKRHVALLPAAADSNGDSNSSDQRQAAATGDSAALSHDPRQLGDMSGLKADGHREGHPMWVMTHQPGQPKVGGTILMIWQFGNYLRGQDDERCRR